MIFQCEGIIEEFEDSIISLLIRKENNVKWQFCTNTTKLCNPADFTHEDDAEENDIDEERDEL